MGELIVLELRWRPALKDMNALRWDFYPLPIVTTRWSRKACVLQREHPTLRKHIFLKFVPLLCMKFAVLPLDLRTLFAFLVQTTNDKVLVVECAPHLTGTEE